MGGQGEPVGTAPGAHPARAMRGTRPVGIVAGTAPWARSPQTVPERPGRAEDDGPTPSSEGRSCDCATSTSCGGPRLRRTAGTAPGPPPCGGAPGGRLVREMPGGHQGEQGEQCRVAEDADRPEGDVFEEVVAVEVPSVEREAARDLGAAHIRPPQVEHTEVSTCGTSPGDHGQPGTQSLIASPANCLGSARWIFDKHDPPVLSRRFRAFRPRCRCQINVGESLRPEAIRCSSPSRP